MVPVLSVKWIVVIIEVGIGVGIEIVPIAECEVIHYSVGIVFLHDRQIVRTIVL